MKKGVSSAVLLAGACLLMSGGAVDADVFHMGPGLTSLETVPVGDPGNAGEWSGEGYGGYGPARVCGGVDYSYRIGKYEVTAGQYCVFLNAVAKTDPYGLYNGRMDRVNEYGWGCNIKRVGSSGSYSYSVAADCANVPVNYVDWSCAARFVNWLHNGQPTGAPGRGTTEDGAYDLVMWMGPAFAEPRKADAKWAIPTEDEWYKAAYYKGGSTSAGYWDYPTGTDATPSNAIADPDPGNNANFNRYPYMPIAVGTFTNSESPYGTFDQGGNVVEWTETLVGNRTIVRGGNVAERADAMEASMRYHSYGDTTWHGGGFRVVQVPEPATLALLAIGGAAILRRRRKSE